jgi:hypothetical protein
MSPSMYCGLVDDFAIKYGIGNPIKTLDGLNSHLVGTVLFGDEMVINDGHLLLNPAVRASVLDESRSPLRCLVNNGFVKILTRRQHRLDKLAEFMDSEGIETASALLADPEYERSLLPALQQWSADLKSSDADCWLDWPQVQVNDIYKVLAATTLAELPRRHPQLAMQFARFVRESGGGIDSRRSFEAAAEDATWLSAVARRRLMLAANEAHSYMWGCLLSSGADPSAVQSRELSLLQSMDASDGTLAPRRGTPIPFFVPNEAIASRAVGGNWHALGQFADLNSRVSRAKLEFKTALAHYSTGDGVDRSQMREAANAYGIVLAEEFGRGKGKKVVFAIGALALGGAVAVAAAAPPVAIGIGTAVALGLIPMAADTKRFKTKLVARVAMPKARRFVDETDASRCDTWFRVDPAQAAEIVKLAKPFTPKIPGR